jgi:hypothetical protein
VEATGRWRKLHNEELHDFEYSLTFETFTATECNELFLCDVDADHGGRDTLPNVGDWKLTPFVDG